MTLPFNNKQFFIYLIFTIILASSCLHSNYYITEPTITAIFVTVGGGGKASYSDDGISWITADHNNVSMKAVTVGDAGKASYSDDDGISWTAAVQTNGSMTGITAQQ